jgi:hypothetical protein
MFFARQPPPLRFNASWGGEADACHLKAPTTRSRALSQTAKTIDSLCFEEAMSPLDAGEDFPSGFLGDGANFQSCLLSGVKTKTAVSKVVLTLQVRGEEAEREPVRLRRSRKRHDERRGVNRGRRRCVGMWHCRGVLDPCACDG